MPINIERIKRRISNITATNRNDLYNSHLYWSQKPFNIADVLIEEFTEENEIIFDPFLGSGVTVLEAIRNDYKRIGIGCELNETPLFIIKTLLRNYDLEKYASISKNFISKIKKYEYLYETDCISCEGTGLINKVIFDKPTRKSRNKIKVIEYSCEKCGKRLTKLPNKDDINKMNIKVKTSNISNLKLIPNSKIAVYKDSYILDIFTNRNFMILDNIIGVVNKMDTDYQNVFRYLILSIIHLSKITDKRSNSQWPLWIPKKDCVEKNVISLVERKIKRFKKTIKYINANYDNPQVKLLHKGSQNISNDDIPDDYVDLVITDPPYMGQVAYSEYMQLYKPFLNLEFDIENEIVVTNNKQRKKDKEEYFELLNRVFKITAKKLKNQKYMCMYFHDSNLDVWSRLISSLSENNMRYISQVHIRKSNTLKNILSPKKSLNGDALLFFIKDKSHNKYENAKESIEEIESNIIRHIKQTVVNSGPLSTPELYDNGLMEYLIYNNWLDIISNKYKTLIPIFEKHLVWDKELGKWR